MSKDGAAGTNSVRIKLWQASANTTSELTDEDSVKELFEQADQLVTELERTDARGLRTVRVDSLAIVPAARRHEYRWCSAAHPLPISDIKRWLLRHPASSEDPSEEPDVFKAFRSLPNFHSSDNVPSSSSSGSSSDTEGEHIISAPNVTLFSQSSSVRKQKKPLHMYGRKSTARRKVIESPKRVEIPPLEAFRELLAEAAEDRLVESPPKNMKTKTVLSVKRTVADASNDEITDASIYEETERGTKRKMPLTAAAAPPPLPQGQPAGSDVAIRGKRPYKFKKPFPLHLSREFKPSRLDEATSIQREGGLHEEATEIIEDYSDSSMRVAAGDGEGEGGGMILEEISRQSRDTILVSSSRSGPSALADPPDYSNIHHASSSHHRQPELRNVSFASTLSSTSLILSTTPGIIPHSLPLRSTNLVRSPETTILPSNRRTSLEVPPAAQRKRQSNTSVSTSSVGFYQSAAQEQQVDESSALAPDITLTTPTSPPNPFRLSSTSRPIPHTSSNPQGRKRKRIDDTVSIPLSTFLNLALPLEFLRPSFPPTLPFRHMSRPVAPARIIHPFVVPEDLHQGGVFGSGYLGVGRRGWWVLPLEGILSGNKHTERKASGGIVLGLQEGPLPAVPPGTIVWTLPRLRLLFRQVHAMTKTRKWGLLDIYVSPSSSSASSSPSTSSSTRTNETIHELRIVCQTSMALMLRAILGEVACRLTTEGDGKGGETEEPADANMQEDKIGEMWLSAERGVRLSWWDEMDRKEVLLA